ncbi:MAG: RNA polymerase-binding protein DksA [Desulfobacterales bacterium]|jgi:DnaK suppressor protein
MKSQEMAILRRILEEELNELAMRAETTVGDLLNDITDIEPDPLDRASSEQNRGYTFRIRSRESRLIKKIKNCLQAMDEGEYGICESCGEPIAVARLMARPVTSYCIDCKRKQEAYERAAG